MTNTLIIKPHQLAVELGVSTTTLWRWGKSKTSNFPKPVYIGNKTLGWDRKSIIRWIENNELKGVA